MSYAVYRFIVKRGYMDIFLRLELEGAKIKDISKETQIVYRHLTTVLQEMQKNGLIDRIPDKNMYEVVLTNKGKALCNVFKQLKKVVEAWEEPITQNFEGIDMSSDPSIDLEDFHCHNEDTNCNKDFCECGCDGCEKTKDDMED